jgi:glycosyltransferase involved in cell wall biosynthesis
MKVFFPLEVFYPSQAGGTSNAVYWLTKNLVKQGFEPVIVASDEGLPPGVPLNRWSENEAGRAVYVRTRHVHFPITQTLYSLWHFRNADVVHLSSVFYPAAFITGIAARLLGKKTIWSVHGELDPAALKHSSGRKAPILRVIKWLMGNYPLFHSTCDEETRYIRDVFGDNARIVQITNFIEVPDQVERVDGNYLLYIGRLHPKKGIENLINALSMTDAFLRSDRMLKIAGKGKLEYEADLRDLITSLKLDSKVEFVGQVEGNQKEQLLAGASWTIMPSHTENFGLVVVESLAQGTPVIASKGSPWEVLDKEGLGFWTENSPEALSEVLARVMAMGREEYEEYRKRGRPFVEQHFDMQKNIGRWVETYRGMS